MDNMKVNHKAYEVYVRLDEFGRITDINSSVFVPADWGTHVDEGYGDKYAHAQNHYLNSPLLTDDGIPRYKLVAGKPVERTPEEIQADRDAIPPAPPTEIEQLQAENKMLSTQLKASTDRQDFIEDCIAEMAMQVYSV